MVLRQRDELATGQVVNEDFAGFKLVDPTVQVSIAPLQPRSDCRERPQVLQLDQHVLLDRGR
jgi:hypothetical protein